VRALVRSGHAAAEVYVKRGRSRRVERTPHGKTASLHQEKGWAVRAGNKAGGSFFATGTGDPPRRGPWPTPHGPPLALPEPAEVPAWSAPLDFDAPLLGESEALRLLEHLGRELATELPGTRLLHAALEDGASEGELASSRKVYARYRHRLAALHVTACGPGRTGPSAALYLAARDARGFHPPALARRLADRLSVAANGRPPEPGLGGEVLLAPAAATVLLAALLPLFVGPRAGHRWTAFRDGRSRIGSDALTLLDDGRLPGGLFESGVDGEGVPTRPVALVEQGIYRQPLVAWWQGPGEGAPTGCSRRSSWRDLPTPGPTHLYLRPDPKVGVGALLGAVRRGAYLIDATGAARADLDADRFALPVCGFALEKGRAVAPLHGALLHGRVSAFLRGLQAAARDLAFHPLDGMIGSPTLLVSGLELSAVEGPAV
jgi:predicted Zn-dependent protease